MKRCLPLLVLILCMIVDGALLAGGKDDVHLFQTYFRDAAHASSSYGSGLFGFNDFDGLQILNLGVRAGFPISSRFEIGGGVAFLDADPDAGDGESGLSDIRVTGKYHLRSRSATQFSIGASITLPVGEENLGQNEGNFSFFGAVRHPLTRSTVLTGVLGLEFLEGAPVGPGGWPGIFVGGPDKETSLLIGGGIIQEVGRDVNLVGELNITTEGEFALLTGGLDYQMASGGRLRGLLGLGMDDGAPDIALVMEYLIFFR